MTYPNAHRGIEKIHIAEIMIIAGTILMGIVQAIVSVQDVKTIISEFGEVPGVIIAIMIILGMILMIAGDIFNIWGLRIAGRDDKMFYVPYVLSIMIILTDIVIGIILFITNKGNIDKIIDVAEEVVELVQMVVVIVVSSKLAKSLNGTAHVTKSRVVLWLIIINVVFSFGLGASSLLTDVHNKVLYGISEALEIISFIVYLIYVDITIKFLKEN
ncbi:MAG TPA: hypothetical protein DCR12_06340 [Lachnospiraceae bacterium]|nr:hypothetical protein [Lachnospiraceae bacterium]